MSNFKVIGTKTFKLEELSVDALKGMAKKANERIRAEHKETVKKVLAKVKQQDKIDVKTAKKKLAEQLQNKLIRVAKRRKADLLTDLRKNKKHLDLKTKKPKEEKPVPKKPSPEEKPQSKPEYITRRVGGKIRRIPVSSLKKAEEKKVSKKDEKKPVTKSSFLEPPFDCDKCPSKSYTKTCVKCMKQELKIAEQAEKDKRPTPKITITEADDEGPKKQEDVKSKLPPLPKENVKLRIAPKKKAAPKNDELKALKKRLKELGATKRMLKFTKTVERAKELIEEYEEEQDTSIKVIPQFKLMVSEKNRSKVENLVSLIMPRNEFTLADQRDYLSDLKDMAEEWSMQAYPRIKYDAMPEAEKELFRIMFPALFTAKAKEPDEPKKKKKVTKTK